MLLKKVFLINITNLYESGPLKHFIITALCIGIIYSIVIKMAYKVRIEIAIIISIPLIIFLTILYILSM